jgi:hypothetical protein
MHHSSADHKHRNTCIRLFSAECRARYENQIFAHGQRSFPAACVLGRAKAACGVKIVSGVQSPTILSLVFRIPIWGRPLSVLSASCLRTLLKTALSSGRRPPSAFPSVNQNLPRELCIAPPLSTSSSAPPKLANSSIPCVGPSHNRRMRSPMASYQSNIASLFLSSVSSTVGVLYLGPLITIQQIWIRPCSLQWQITGEPSTSYQIWSHCSC